MNDPWVSYNDGFSKTKESVNDKTQEGEGRDDMVYTHFEFLVPLQNLRAQRGVVHRALMVVVNDAAFPVLGPVRSGLCPRLALTLIQSRRARRLGQLYALSRKSRPITSAI